LVTTEKILPDDSSAVRARCEHKCPCRETVILTKEAARWHGRGSDFVESRSMNILHGLKNHNTKVFLVVRYGDGI
jgi:hypothetical protein